MKSAPSTETAKTWGKRLLTTLLFVTLPIWLLPAFVFLLIATLWSELHADLWERR